MLQTDEEIVSRGIQILERPIELEWCAALLAIHCDLVGMLAGLSVLGEEKMGEKGFKV